MNEAIARMLTLFGPMRDARDEDNALKEIIQRITLLGLHRGNFFERASFYGGTALRILYGLDRFSEDMDFCLDTPDPHFSFQPYLPHVSVELARYGFTARLEEKRAGPDVAIGSAFVKQNTLRGLLVIERKRRVPRDQMIKVRLEVDKENPPGSKRIKKLVKMPVPFMVSTLSESSLFAGKLHALIARRYADRVKGRDYYDFLFYAARETPVNMTYVEAKLRDSGHYTEKDVLTRDGLIVLLQQKFATVDFDKARSDVQPFIKADQIAALNDWSSDLFCAMAEALAIEG